MATLVLAIETIGRDWDVFSPACKRSLLKSRENKNLIPNSNEFIQKQLIDRLSLSPFTGKIISLAMYDIERELGAVYFVADNYQESFVDGLFTYKTRTEKEIIEDFWEGAGSYDLFVTFNGRSFTIPFIYQRSAANKIVPRLEIARQRSLVQQSFPYHVDLLEEFSAGGAVQPKPSLAVLADMYGIEYNPGCDGGDVAEFFHQKKFRHIAERNASNVLALVELYKVWKRYLAPVSFINAIEM